MWSFVILRLLEPDLDLHADLDGSLKPNGKCLSANLPNAFDFALKRKLSLKPWLAKRHGLSGASLLPTWMSLLSENQRVQVLNAIACAATDGGVKKFVVWLLEGDSDVRNPPRVCSRSTTARHARPVATACNPGVGSQVRRAPRERAGQRV
eukprot:m.144943 g.144943  ORF g.144943 m.144943 type:complete len:151 (-) comp17210_c0_seq1:550-1002(-)